MPSRRWRRRRWGRQLLPERYGPSNQDHYYDRRGARTCGHRVPFVPAEARGRARGDTTPTQCFGGTHRLAHADGVARRANGDGVASGRDDTSGSRLNRSRCSAARVHLCGTVRQLFQRGRFRESHGSLSAHDRAAPALDRTTRCNGARTAAFPRVPEHTNGRTHRRCSRLVRFCTASDGARHHAADRCA